MAGILDTSVSLLPDDPRDVIEALRAFSKKGKSGLDNVIDPPNPPIDNNIINIFNPEGTANVGLGNSGLYSWLMRQVGDQRIEINPPPRQENSS